MVISKKSSQEKGDLSFSRKRYGDDFLGYSYNRRLIFGKSQNYYRCSLTWPIQNNWWRPSSFPELVIDYKFSDILQVIRSSSCTVMPFHSLNKWQVESSSCNWTHPVIPKDLRIALDSFMSKKRNEKIIICIFPRNELSHTFQTLSYIFFYLMIYVLLIRWHVFTFTT